MNNYANKLDNLNGVGKLSERRKLAKPIQTVQGCDTHRPSTWGRRGVQGQPQGVSRPA